MATQKEKLTMTNQNSKDMKTEDKKGKATDLRELLAEQLRRLHPKLPAYFCYLNGYIVPIAHGEDADRKMAELCLERIDPDGHVDEDVLWAIYEIFAEAHDDFWPPYYVQRAMSILSKALRNQDSKLNYTLQKAYGEVQ